MTLIVVLSRTLLLMRTDLDASVSDAELAAALTSIKVVLHAGWDAMVTHSGQSALVTAALTLARSGHEVWVDGEEVDAIGPQPPLARGPLLAALRAVGDDLLPDRPIQLGVPSAPDVSVVFGQAQPAADALRVISVDASGWEARQGLHSTPWTGGDWPVGGIGVGVLVASEAFRIAMRRLAGRARDRAYFDAVYAPSSQILFPLAPPDNPRQAQLPEFDFVSGGAIANAALFTLARLPGVSGRARVLDDDVSAMSNLNRNAMLTRSALDRYKVEDLARLTGGLVIDPRPVRYEDGMAIAPTVLVGVDDIASRWAVQAAGPLWLGVGATEGFSAMVSSHAEGQACAGCLHPVAAAPAGPIPTAAFVSLLSGLLLVAGWQRALGADGEDLANQQTFVNALRPEGWSFGSMPVAPNENCPVGCKASVRRRAA